LDYAIDKKLALAKLKNQLVSTNIIPEKVIDDSLTEKDKDLLRDIFKEKSESQNIKYDLD